MSLRVLAVTSFPLFLLVQGKTHEFHNSFTQSDSNVIRGGVLALANIFPSDCIQLQDLYNAAQLSKARDLQLALVPVNQAVTKQFGSN